MTAPGHMRIEQTFARAKAEDRAALVIYLMCGHPGPADVVEHALAAVEAGADVLELGIPFSDPLADGPVIQQAGTTALDNGMTVERCLELAHAVCQEVDVPVLLMGYWNPLRAFGIVRLCERASRSGVAGLIVPDLPPEEAEPLLEPAREADLATVFLVAPTSTDERIRHAVVASSGFLYCVALTGVTGAEGDGGNAARDLVRRARAITELPLALGFGLSTPAQVEEAAAVADGVVVGSGVLRHLDAAAASERRASLAEYVSGLRAATARHRVTSGGAT